LIVKNRQEDLRRKVCFPFCLSILKNNNNNNFLSLSSWYNLCWRDNSIFLCYKYCLQTRRSNNSTISWINYSHRGKQKHIYSRGVYRNL